MANFLHIFLPEHCLEFPAADFAAKLVHRVIRNRPKLALHIFRQLDAEFAFEQIRDATFA